MPARDIGGADGRGVILASPADQAVERFGVAMVAGRVREMRFGHFTNSDDPLTTLQCAWPVLGGRLETCRVLRLPLFLDR